MGESDKSRLEIFPGLWLDYRRAVFLEEDRTLAVADLHLGYAWAHRYNGQLLPVHMKDDLLGRLREICAFYKPAQLAILGDIVHEAAPVAEISDELAELLAGLGKVCGLKLILGNHDRRLVRMLGAGFNFLDGFETEKFLLIHGNDMNSMPAGKFVIMGHEHPAISIGDGIASAKFPCFVVGSRALLLPAFSNWAAGSSIRNCDFMSPLARKEPFDKAIAICGTKLLPVRLK